MSAEVRGLVEREGCLAAITAVLGASPDGRGRGLLIEGPAGIGKTAMLEEAERRAVGMVVLRAAGGELEADVPLGVVRQLFEPVLWRATDSERTGWLRGPALLAGRIVGGADGDGDADVPAPVSADPAAVRSAFYWLAVAIAEARGAVVVIDDLHWVDAESLAWIVYLARRLRGSGISLVCAARAGEPGIEEAVLRPLAVLDEVQVQRLVALSPEGTARLVAAWSGTLVPAERFTASCQRLAGGNPYLLTELLAEAARQGVKPDPAGADRLDGLAGGDLARAVSARVTRLRGGPAALVRAVAILGAGARLRDAANLAGLETERAASETDRLIAAGVLRDADPLEFQHPLVRAAVLSELTSAKRAELHRRAASVIASSDASAERIGAHLLLAAPSGDAWVVERLVAAAVQARARGAPEGAARFLLRALEEPPQPDVRANVHASLGSALCTAGDSAGLRHIEIARELTADRDERHLLAARLGTPYTFLGRGDDVARMIRRELDEVVDDGSLIVFSIRAALAATPAYGALFDPRPLVTELLGEAENLTKIPTVARPTLALLAIAACAAAFPCSVVRELAWRALGDPADHEAAIAEGFPLLPAIAALIAAGDLDGLEERLNAAEAGVRRRGAIALGLGTLLWTRGTFDLARGELAGAAEHAEAAVELAAEGSFSIPRAHSAVLSANVLRERGEIDGAERALAGCPPDAASGMWAMLRREEVAAIALTRADYLTASRESLAAGEQLERIGVVNPLITQWRSIAALAAQAHGERDEGARLAAGQLQIAEAFGAPAAVGSALRVHGVILADLDELERAERALSGSGAQLEHARALVDLGAALRRRGQRVRAREPLFAGLESAGRCGAEPLVERALSELRVAGARPRSVVRTGVEALTPSERRVARLAAEGRTNREISGELFVTKATVETHLRSIYRKLDISSRADLGERLGVSALSERS